MLSGTRETTCRRAPAKGSPVAVRTTPRARITKAAARTSSSLDDHLIDYLTAPVVQTTVILALVTATKAFGFSKDVDWVLVRLLFSLLLLFWGRAWFRATTLLIQSLSSDLNRYAGRLEAFAGEFTAILSRQLEEG